MSRTPPRVAAVAAAVALIALGGAGAAGAAGGHHHPHRGIHRDRRDGRDRFEVGAGEHVMVGNAADSLVSDDAFGADGNLTDTGE